MSRCRTFRADEKGVGAVFRSMNRAVVEYRGAAYEEGVRGRKAFYWGKKEGPESAAPGSTAKASGSDSGPAAPSACSSLTEPYPATHYAW